MNVLESMILYLSKSEVKTQGSLAGIKRKTAKKHKIPCPNNIALLKTYHELLKKKKIKKSIVVESLLKTRPVRSLSGIVNISVLTKPYPCPGRCLYCPQESGIPKSYVSGEPAVERAKRLNYDPYLQAGKRIEMLEWEGHPTDKIELRTVGGTWSFYPKKYQDWFIKRCFEACNKKNSKNLKMAQRSNEKAKHRVVGLSVETRPDFINVKETERRRKLGVTMVELGVQTIYDNILKLNLRGHGVKETILATKLLKDAGFKILYQMMPNLPGSDLKRDEKMFKELFSDSRFQPDLLKIYPCALLKEAPLYKLWKKGKYHPYTKQQLISLIESIKKEIPYYVRIQRITRDIPSKSVVAGPAKISNLRQILLEGMKRGNRQGEENKSSSSPFAGAWQCKCIRCREVKESYMPKEKIYLFREDYSASDGKEMFLSFENKNRTKLYSLLRLRLTSRNEAVIREVHTYGQLLSIVRGLASNNSPQHKGLGRKLIKEAEKITGREFNLKKISVIAGIGARDYFRKLGYKLKNTYMVKNIRKAS